MAAKEKQFSQFMAAFDWAFAYAQEEVAGGGLKPIIFLVRVADGKVEERGRVTLMVGPEAREQHLRVLEVSALFEEIDVAIYLREDTSALSHAQGIVTIHLLSASHELVILNPRDALGFIERGAVDVHQYRPRRFLNGAAPLSH